LTLIVSVKAIFQHLKPEQFAWGNLGKDGATYDFHDWLENNSSKRDRVIGTDWRVLYHWRGCRESSESLSMPSRRKTSFVALLVVGLFSAPLLLWYFILNNVAVYRTISPAPGTVTQNFWLNYSGYYRLGIQAERKGPHGQIECSLGLEKGCEDTPVLRYSWALSCDGGRMTRSGTWEKLDVGGAYAAGVDRSTIRRL
jgi:hypothetical protein